MCPKMCWGFASFLTPCQNSLEGCSPLMGNRVLLGRDGYSRKEEKWVKKVRDALQMCPSWVEAVPAAHSSLLLRSWR